MTVHRAGGLIEEERTHSIIGAFYRVYNKLGFGFLEHVYAACLELELRRRGHSVAREYSVVIRYEGVGVARQRLDMVIDERVVVEIKSTARLHDDAARQIYSYLRATDLEVGLLLHFGREARFYRLICEKPKPRLSRINPTDPRNSTDP